MRDDAVLLAKGYKDIGFGKIQVRRALQKIMFRLSYRRYVQLLQRLESGGEWLP